MTANSFVKPCSIWKEAIEIAQGENAHWRAYEEGGQYHHFLRDRRNSI
ncbi:MAG TPA: hypothetical protein VF220_07005 [Nitrososphaeraceae archaeon]